MTHYGSPGSIAGPLTESQNADRADLRGLETFAALKPRRRGQGERSLAGAGLQGRGRAQGAGKRTEQRKGGCKRKLPTDRFLDLLFLF